MAKLTSKKKCNLKKSWIKAEIDEHGHLFKKDMRLKMGKSIVKDHIKELGCKYYPELFKMEKKLKKEMRKLR